MERFNVGEQMILVSWEMVQPPNAKRLDWLMDCKISLRWPWDIIMSVHKTQQVMYGVGEAIPMVS